MRCNIEAHDVTAVMAEHDKHIENVKCGGRDREEINPNYTVGMVFEKRPPGLGWRITVSNHVLYNSGLGYLDAKNFQFGAPRGASSLAVERTAAETPTQCTAYRVLSLWR